MRTESWGVILSLDLSVYTYVGFHLTKYPFREGPNGAIVIIYLPLYFIRASFILAVAQRKNCEIL